LPAEISEFVRRAGRDFGQSASRPVGRRAPGAGRRAPGAGPTAIARHIAARDFLRTIAS